MSIDILMPALSPTMKDGTVVRWHKLNGQYVNAGDVLTEIETDKAIIEVEAVDEGFLEILVDSGTSGVLVNSIIAKLSLEQPTATANNNDSNKPDDSKSNFELGPKAGNTDIVGQRCFASPLAKNIAKQNNIDLSMVLGSGPNGRIVKDDVLRTIDAPVLNNISPPIVSSTFATTQVTSTATDNTAVSHNPVLASPATLSHATPILSGATNEVSTRSEPVAPMSIMAAEPSLQNIVPHSQMRRVIANRLVESKQQIPHFYLTAQCNLDKLLELRANIFAERNIKISLNDFVIKATGVCLRNIPEINAAWTQSGMIFHSDVDVSFAVSVDGGLITPIIHNVDTKPLSMIAIETRDLASKARSQKLLLHEFSGGGFTVSNLGMYGIQEFYAIINPPQSAIMAIGQTKPTPIVKDGAICIASMMSVSLSCDHRIIDGVVGARFLDKFIKLIENPSVLLI